MTDTAVYEDKSFILYILLLLIKYNYQFNYLLIYFIFLIIFFLDSFFLRIFIIFTIHLCWYAIRQTIYIVTIITWALANLEDTSMWHMCVKKFQRWKNNCSIMTGINIQCINLRLNNSLFFFFLFNYSFKYIGDYSHCEYTEQYQAHTHTYTQIYMYKFHSIKYYYWKHENWLFEHGL